jgi:hypothetical protein
VDWRKSWKLLGIDEQGRRVNVYEQRGLYVLYDDYVPVYVGKADRQSIGYRIQLHRESQRKGPRWDRFSWFGLRRINKGSELGQLKGRFGIDTSQLISTLEAMVIIIADPRLNSRREKLRGALKLQQSEEGRPPSADEIELKRLNDKLDEVLHLLQRQG